MKLRSLLAYTALSFALVPFAQAMDPASIPSSARAPSQEETLTDGQGLRQGIESMLWSETRAHTLRGSLFSSQGILAKSPEALARDAIAAHQDELGLSADSEDLRLEEAKDTPLGTTVRFQRFSQGLPVDPGVVLVQLHQGEVQWITSEGERHEVYAQSDSFKAPPSKSDVIAAAMASIGADAELVSEPVVTPMVQAKDGASGRVHEVKVATQNPTGEFRVLVSDDGRILSKEDQRFFAHATVFLGNAVVAAGNHSFGDNGDSNSGIPASAYSQVELKGLDSSGKLSGQFVSTELSNERASADSDGNFHFNRSQKGFEEVMIYHHIDMAQRYFQSLGFNNVNNRVQKVHPHGTTADNSFYSPWNKNLTFGTGGVDDGEDGEIIWHEYGHSTQDNQVPGWGRGGHARAMGEAFGDFLAAAMSAKISNFQNKCVGDWDAVSYSNANPPCLRRVDGTKHFPEDLKGQEHADGEIWSAALWKVYEGMANKDDSMKLVLAHHFLLAPGATMPQAAEALLQADQNLFQGANQALIRSVMEARGILSAQGRGRAKSQSRSFFGR